MIKSLVCTIGRLCFLLKKKEMPLENIKKILFLKTGAIGDTLMTTPLVRSVRKKYPKSEIVYVIGKWSESVLKGNKNIDKIITFDENIIFKKNKKKLKELAKKLKKEKFDLCFVLDKSYLASLFAYWCKIPIRVGFDRNGEGFANTHNIEYGPLKHEIQYYLNLGERIGIKPDDIEMDFAINKKTSNKAVKFLKKYIKQKNINHKKIIGIAPGGAFNPGVGIDVIRRWPAEKFTELAGILSEKHLVLIIGNENDKDIVNREKRNTIDLCGKNTLEETAAFISLCDVFVCNDSGLMHLASAVGTPVVSLFGPSSPERKAPLKNSIAIWKDQNIYEESYEVYGKRPKNKNFFANISIDDVLDAVNKLIKERYNKNQCY